MPEKRKAPRVKKENEVTITVVSGGKHQKIIYDSSNDISVSGARIHTHILFPVDTLLRINIMLETVQQLITVMGKVKWIKIIYRNEDYEAGVEFFNTPEEVIKILKDYISLKLEFEN
jgi:hypothetical protein